MTRWYLLRPADESVFAAATHVYRYPIRLPVTLGERFFRWDEGKGYSFYVESTNRPGLTRFAEHPS